MITVDEMIESYEVGGIDSCTRLLQGGMDAVNSRQVGIIVGRVLKAIDTCGVADGNDFRVMCRILSDVTESECIKMFLEHLVTIRVLRVNCNSTLEKYRKNFMLRRDAALEASSWVAETISCDGDMSFSGLDEALSDTESLLLIL